MKQYAQLLKIQNSELRNSIRRYGGILLALVILCVFFSLYTKGRFATFQNITNTVQQVAVVAVAAFGMTWVILLGEIDLSIGSIIAVAGMVGAQILALGYGFAPAIIITLLAGILMGFLNGTLTTKLLLPSFIVTVATMGIYRGLVNLPTNGSSQKITDPTWLAISKGAWLGLPIIIWIVIVLFLVNHILLTKTTFGRRTYLTGGNKEAALYSGIKVDRLKIQIFMLSGLMAAIAGILFLARVGLAQTNAASGYELDAIAAAVLGGTSLSGGVGTMVGTLIGALIIGVMNNGMNMLSVPPFYQIIAKGLVILFAVWLDVRAKRKRG